MVINILSLEGEEIWNGWKFGDKNPFQQAIKNIRE